MEWLYPELERIDPKDRSSALQQAKDGASRYRTCRYRYCFSYRRIRDSVLRNWNGCARAHRRCVLELRGCNAPFADVCGPFYVRRVRRRLRDTLKSTCGPKRIKTQ